MAFGLLGLKAYTMGERVLRIEATVHNTKDLGCGRVLERFPEIVGRLGAMAHRFASALDCASVGFVSDGILDTLPTPTPDRAHPRGRHQFGLRLASGPYWRQ